MNPFGNMNTQHSTWPVLFCMYNLAPWLCMKKVHHDINAYTGPKQPGNDIDTYLQLLVEELQILWKDEGLKCWDAYKNELFNQHAILLSHAWIRPSVDISRTHEKPSTCGIVGSSENIIHTERGRRNLTIQ